MATWTRFSSKEGKVYYQNDATLATQWEEPAEAERWKAHADSDGRVYYYNVVTEQTSWNKPGVKLSGVLHAMNSDGKFHQCCYELMEDGSFRAGGTAFACSEIKIIRPAQVKREATPEKCFVLELLGTDEGSFLATLAIEGVEALIQLVKALHRAAKVQPKKYEIDPDTATWKIVPTEDAPHPAPPPPPPETALATAASSQKDDSQGAKTSEVVDTEKIPARSFEALEQTFGRTPPPPPPLKADNVVDGANDLSSVCIPPPPEDNIAPPSSPPPPQPPSNGAVPPPSLSSAESHNSAHQGLFIPQCSAPTEPPPPPPTPKVASAGTASMELRVVIHKAKGLAAADLNGKSDPYCILNLGDVVFKTSVVRTTLNPDWGNTTFRFPTVGVNEGVVMVRVMDKDDYSSDDVLGEVEVPFNKTELFMQGEKRAWFPVKRCAGMRSLVRAKGSVELTLAVLSPEEAQAASWRRFSGNVHPDVISVGKDGLWRLTEGRSGSLESRAAFNAAVSVSLPAPSQASRRSELSSKVTKSVTEIGLSLDEVLARRDELDASEGLDCHLSDHAFREAMRMPRGQFSKLPAWKQQRLREAAGLGGTKGGSG